MIKRLIHLTEERISYYDRYKKTNHELLGRTHINLIDDEILFLQQQLKLLKQAVN